MMIDTILKIQLTTTLVFVDFKEKSYTRFKTLDSHKISEIWDFLKKIESTLRQYEGDPLFYTSHIESMIKVKPFLEGKYLMWDLSNIGVYGYVFMAKSGFMDTVLKRFFKDENFVYTETSEFIK